MKLSKVIKTLEKMKENYGDVEVLAWDEVLEDLLDPLITHDTETNTIYIKTDWE